MKTRKCISIALLTIAIIALFSCKNPEKEFDKNKIGSLFTINQVESKNGLYTIKIKNEQRKPFALSTTTDPKIEQVVFVDSITTLTISGGSDLSFYIYKEEKGDTKLKKVGTLYYIKDYLE